MCNLVKKIKQKIHNVKVDMKIRAAIKLGMVSAPKEVNNENS